MSSGAMKDLKRQLRNVVQDILPEVLKNEIYTSAVDQARKDLSKQLKLIQDEIRTNLSLMDERSKGVQQYILNQISAEQARNAAPMTPVQEHVASDSNLGV